LLATAAVLVVGANSSVAYAQQVSGDTVDEVVVTGFRKSLSDARNIKRDSVIQKDAIVAEDMAKFPELNLAESLQRLPGVADQPRSGRRPAHLAARPGPRFRPRAAERHGSAGQRRLGAGQPRPALARPRLRLQHLRLGTVLAGRGREDLPGGAERGGMAGTVGLFTGKPFDYAPGTKGALSAEGGHQRIHQGHPAARRRAVQPQLGQQVRRLVSVAYSKRKTTEQGHNTYNYDQPDADTLKSMVANGLTSPS
jgi:iron complex outermembrane receptor protein